MRSVTRLLEVEHVLPYPVEQAGGLLEKALRELDVWELGFVERETGVLRGAVKCGFFSTDETLIRLESLSGPATKVFVCLTGNTLFYREALRRHRIAELFEYVEKMSRA